MIFDSHAHYDDRAFNEDREAVITKIKEAGVKRVLNCASSLKTCDSTIELTRKYDFFYGAIGIHPQDAIEAIGNINKLADYLSDSKMKAVGEIGLDYYYDEYDRNVQQRVFREQMDLASQLDLPVIIHDRDAHEDTLRIIKEFKNVRGVLHCFSGSTEFAKQILKLDYYIGFTGVVTFKNAKKAVEAVRHVPMERLLVETDCPYMSPEPHRGHRCDSSLLEHTIRKISVIKELDYDTVCKEAYKNASMMLKIEEE